MKRVLPALACWLILTESFGQSMPTARQLENDVRFLASEIGERNPGHYDNLQKARAWLTKSLSEALGPPHQQIYQVNGRDYANLVASRPGSRPELGSIVIGAHYDSAHGTPGADDNASAVAVMLELARRFSQEKTRHTLEFAAFTLEEPPYFRSDEMGSMKLAADWQKQGKKIKLMICLEMLGFFTDKKVQEFPLPGMGLLYPNEGNFIAAIGHTGPPEAVVRFTELLKQRAAMPVVAFNGPKMLPGIDFSDHQSFWNYGFPALMITDTAFYRNPHYHGASDTPETLNYPAMAQVVETLFQAIRAYDQAE